MQSRPGFSWRRAARVVVGLLVSTSLLVGGVLSALAAAPPGTWKVVPTPGGGAYGSSLSGVAVVSASDVWAVGSTGDYSPLILRWNGSAWSTVSAPSGV